jgi:phosphatidylserine/phosphatidylglycerophosphate/cardiolipin synthase-like enzyme
MGTGTRNFTPEGWISFLAKRGMRVYSPTLGHDHVGTGDPWCTSRLSLAVLPTFPSARESIYICIDLQ